MKNIVRMAAIIATLFLSQSVFAQKQCGIVAHRGFWNCDEAGYAKNSVAALRCAQEQGFWGSEFDVNMTSDGVLIVYHDSDVEGKKIEKHPYSEFADFRIANGEVIPPSTCIWSRERNTLRPCLYTSSSLIHATR